MNTRFAAVVPVIDERDTIADVVRELHAAGTCCVVVVDGASTDGTPDIARAAGATVITEARRGYGRACLTGAEHATRCRARQARHGIIAFLDGDGSCAGDDVRRLVDALETADVALGVRPAERIEAGALPWHARLGNGLVANIVSIRTGRRVHDLPPAKAIRTSALARLDLDAEGYGWTVQFIARAVGDRGLRIREVPVAFRARRGGRSKVSGSVRTSVLAGVSMIRTSLVATRPRPVLTLMAKAPGTGHAKTRLAPDLGDAATASLWTALLADSATGVRGAARALGVAVHVMLPRSDDLLPVAEIIGPEWTFHVQRDPGLSAALIETFLAAFDRGTDRAIAVAADAPLLPPSDIATAFARLAVGSASAVVGPSLDGGYNLIGLRWRGCPRWWPHPVRRRRRAELHERLRAVFEGPLGGTDARRSTLTRLSAAHWRVDQLEARPDVDTVADLDALRSVVERAPHLAPRTAAWLARTTRQGAAMIDESWCFGLSPSGSRRPSSCVTSILPASVSPLSTTCSPTCRRRGTMTT